MSVGTRVSIPNHQYTEIYTTLNQADRKHRSTDPKIQQAKIFMSKLLKDNKSSKFLAKTYVHMILNQELTHVEFYIAKLVSLEAAPADIQASFR